MRNNLGQVVEIRTARSGSPASQLRSAYIACDSDQVPIPGGYLMASPILPAAETASLAVLSVALFRGTAPFESRSLSQPGFWTTASVPADWLPGLKLQLHGPLGKGFRLPADARKLALVNAGGGAGGLLALAELALEKNCPVVFFGDTSDSLQLSAEVEAYPLDSLLELSGWADQLAVSIPLDRLPDLNEILGLSAMSHTRIPIEVLVLSPMPCGGIGKCGVCAYQHGRKWLLACEDGPVICYSP